MARLIQVVKDDHRRLIQLRQRILTSSQNDGLLKAQVVEELQQHISAESQILLPLISERLQDGSKRSENLRHTHEHIINKLHNIESSDCSVLSLRGHLNSLWMQISKHIQDTDHQDLPRVEESISTLDSETLADNYLRAKKPEAIRATARINLRTSLSCGAWRDSAWCCTDYRKLFC
ncbi:hypothetical protein BN1723_010369 [Verticillium longisporum]|uniref:Hemerythrin-like domain-containing protein n=1 Tax=Verticillium longisporum TaxID=100787 RepID=A0A0G4L2P2_VERLO|nr:hypothetical protein HYQ46_001309 [Verticillium longisporum]CRK14534.1 hypothetical protein BN1723_010369 [Verticillium longisporum]CRK15990.1 hypothetical protein BN1708_011621 [Verticillium longisporum]